VTLFPYADWIELVLLLASMAACCYAYVIRYMAMADLQEAKRGNGMVLLQALGASRRTTDMLAIQLFLLGGNIVSVCLPPPGAGIEFSTQASIFRLFVLGAILTGLHKSHGERQLRMDLWAYMQRRNRRASDQTPSDKEE
jgi:hypothetical protein